MPIFQGEEVQRRLEEISRLFSPTHTKQCFGRLTTRDARHVLGAEWEVVVFSALSRGGQIREVGTSAPTGGPASQPDCLFYPNPVLFADSLEFDLPKVFLIEVTAISDRDAEKHNPWRAFHAAFHRLLRRRKLPLQRFSLDFKGAIQKKPSKTQPKQPFNASAWLRPNRNHGHMQLALPRSGEIDAFAKTHLLAWIEQIALQPDRPNNLDFDQDGVRFVANYDPSRPVYRIFSPGGYPSYTATYSIDENPFARRLHDKANQLSRSAHRDLSAGVILCDGGCDLLADQGSGYGGPLSVNLDDVVANCFNHPDFGRISFALALSPIAGVDAWGRVEAPRIRGRLFVNPKATHPVSGKVVANIARQALCANLPQPVNTAPNACHLVAGRGGFPDGAPPFGGFKLPTPV